MRYMSVLMIALFFTHPVIAATPLLEGKVVRNNIAFRIKAPEGWGFENFSAGKNSQAGSFTPINNSLYESSVFFTDIAASRFKSIQSYIDFSANELKKEDPDFNQREIEEGRTSQGYKYKILKQDKPNWQIYEICAYIQLTNSSVAFIVFSTENKSHMEHGIKLLKNALNSVVYVKNN